MDIKILVGQNIKKIRKTHNLTQEELASAVHLSRTSLANIETGRQNVGLENLYEFAIALQVPIGMFFDGAESEQNIVEGINIKYRMLEIQYEKLQKKHQKLIENLSELIKE